MILYADTSALLKLYLVESDSPQVWQAINDAGAVCTCLITYTEMRAAFARAVNMKRLAAGACAELIKAFEADWLALEIISVDEGLARRAGALADHYGLRGYDNMHLAAAERVLITVGAAEFRFAGFDARLNGAAARLGMRLLDAPD